MRKLLGGLLAVVAALFLGLAYTQLAVADDKDKACRDELTKRILELVEADESDILQKQFELTTLKLAEVTVESGSTTLEDYFRTQEKVIDKLDAADIQGRLVGLYSKYGETEDQEEVIERFEASKKLARKGSYWRPSTRFKNQDLSAYAFAHTMLHQAQSPFRAEDVAILWLQAEISEAVTEKAGRGSAAANMTETSTLVARLGGAISGVQGKDLEALKAAKKDTEAQIGAAFDKVVDQFRNELAKVCPELNKDGKVCADCKIAEETKIGALGEAIHKVQEKLRTETGAKEKKVEKVIAEMQANGYEVRLEGQSEKKSDAGEQKVSPEFLKMMNRHYADFAAEMKKPLEFKPFRLGLEPNKNPFGLTTGVGGALSGTTPPTTESKGLTDFTTATRGTKPTTDSLPETKLESDTIPPIRNRDTIPQTKGVTDSLPPKKLTDSLPPQKGVADSLPPQKGVTDTLPPKTPYVFNGVTTQDTGLKKYSTLFWNNDFSYATATPDSSKTKMTSDTATTKKVADRQVATAEPQIIYDKKELFQGYEGCTVHYRVITVNGKVTIQFQLKHEGSGRLYCDGKIYAPHPSNSKPAEFYAASALEVCSSELPLLTKESCKEAEAPKK